MERKIAAVWADVVGIPNPGIHDGFFDSGGDSLAAARLLTGLTTALGTEMLRLGILIEAPTIAELALLLSKPEKHHASLLPLQPSGSGTPLFWIDGFAAVSVVEGLDRNRPVFLLSLPSSTNQDASQLIDDYVEECLRSLRRFRPKGPYLLAGWCAAGVIALEAAQRLKAEGEVVGLIVFDARGVLRHDSDFLRSRWISSVRGTQKLLYHFEKIKELGASSAVGYVTERIMTKSGRVRRGLLNLWCRMLVAPGRDLPATLKNSELLYSMAIRNYRAKPYAGRIVHIWAEDRPKGHFRDLHYEWGSVGKGYMELYEAAGNHVTMFQGANGRALGRLLNNCLNEIEQNGGNALPDVCPSPHMHFRSK